MDEVYPSDDPEVMRAMFGMVPGWRRFTDKEWDLYNKTAVESEGFDAIPIDPKVSELGLLRPISEKELPHFYEELMEYSRSALAQYNNEHGTNYEVAKVLKANLRMTRGVDYYITFQVQDKDTRVVQNFQAIINVMMEFTVGVEKVTVEKVRPEPDKSQLLQEIKEGAGHDDTPYPSERAGKTLADQNR